MVAATTPLTLCAEFVEDDTSKRLGFTGARCELPNGQVVEMKGRRTPLYDLARKLEELDFGDWQLQAYTPTGTPSLQGKVSAMARLTVKERDGGGLRLERFQKFPGRRQVAQGGSEGTQPPIDQIVALRRAS